MKELWVLFLFVPSVLGFLESPPGALLEVSEQLKCGAGEQSGAGCPHTTGNSADSPMSRPSTTKDGRFALPPFYHTTEALLQEVRETITNSPRHTSKELTFMEVEDAETKLKVLVVRAKFQRPSVELLRGNDTSKVEPKRLKVFINFGIHARELISSEVALELVRYFAGAVTLPQRLKDVLWATEWIIVPISNPLGRKKVEQGDDCWRKNPNGVDINRNFDIHWDKGNPDPEADSYHGRTPHSEPEARILKSIAEAFRPNLFVDMHSGSQVMMARPSFTDKIDPDGSMMAELHRLMPYCNCTIGSSARVIGYQSHGGFADFVHYQVGANYSYVFEIFDQHKRLPDKRVDDDTHRNHREHSPTNEGQYDPELALGPEEAECFEQFNPSTVERRNEYATHWAQLVMQLALNLQKFRAST